MTAWAVTLGGLAGLAAWPFALEALRPPADPEAAPGAFAAAPKGPIHYRWHGAETGRIALCIHGLTTPSPVFDPLIPHLVTLGYRVLTFDLPGRGFTPPRPGPQDAAFFQEEVEGLLAALDIDAVDLLIGYSMGGSIATIFAAAARARVGQMVLLAPAGLYHDGGRFHKLVQAVPGLGDWAMLGFGGLVLRREIDRTDNVMADLQIAETRKRGYLPSVLSSLRHLLSTRLPAEHRIIARSDLPVLAIWGEEDAPIPVSNVGRLAELNRNAQQAAIPGATHALPYSHPVEVAGEIADFLQRTGR